VLGLTHFKPLVGIQRQFSYMDFQKLSYFRLGTFFFKFKKKTKMWENECACKIQSQDGKLRHDLLDFFSFWCQINSWMYETFSHIKSKDFIILFEETKKLIVRSTLDYESRLKTIKASFEHFFACYLAPTS